MIWLGLAVSVAFVPGYTGASIPTGWALLSVILPWFLWRQIEQTPSHWLGLAFGAYAVSTLLWAPRTDDALFELWQLGIIGCAFYLGSSLRDMRSLFIGLAIGLTISSALAIGQYYNIESVLRGDSLKSSGLFYNSVIAGEAGALILVGLVAYRLWWLIPGVLPGFILAESRGAVIALASTAILYTVRSIWMAAALGLVVLAAIWLLPQYTDFHRLVTWSIALTTLTPFGHGAGAFQSIYFGDAGKIFHPEHAHNEYLNLVYQYGLGTLLLWPILLLALEQVDAIEWPILICFLVMAIFSWPLHSPVLALVGAAAAGKLSVDWALAGTKRLDGRSRFVHGAVAT